MNTDQRDLAKEYLVEQQNGSEMYFYFEHPRTHEQRCSYTFKHSNGRTFSTIENDVDQARTRRDAWLKRQSAL